MKFLILLLCVVLLAACSKPKPPQYLGYSNVRLEKAGIAANVVAADIKFYNPNPYALKLKQADLDVYVNSRMVGKSIIDSLITLPGRDSSYVPLRMQAAAKDLLGVMAQLALNPNVRLRVKGTARVGRGSVFINLPVDYEGTQRIELLEGEGAPMREQ